MKKLISIVMSGLILWLIYSKINFQAALDIISHANRTVLIGSLLLIIPVLILSSLRLLYLIPKTKKISFFDSLKLILLGNTLNMILPAKLGDISKAFFLNKTHAIKGSLSFAIILAEKAGDMLGLNVICLLGLLIYGPIQGPYKQYVISIGLFTILGFFILLNRRFTHLGFKSLSLIIPQKVTKKLSGFFTAWTSMQKYMLKNPKKIALLLSSSMLISFIHFLGIWVMFLSISPKLPLTLTLALTPFSVLAGLIPITFSGIGTRDAALVALFSFYVSPEIAAAFGLLFTLRLITFALPGILFLKDGLSFKKNI